VVTSPADVLFFSAEIARDAGVETALAGDARYDFRY